VCCKVLQGVARCCKVLQGVARCCSVCDRINAYMRHASITCESISLIVTCVWCVAWLNDVSRNSFRRVTWPIQICMSPSFVWHDSFICVTWLIHMCDMTHSYVWLSHAYVRHDPCVCVLHDMWLIHMWVHCTKSNMRVCIYVCSCTQIGLVREREEEWETERKGEMERWREKEREGAREKEKEREKTSTCVCRYIVRWRKERGREWEKEKEKESERERVCMHVFKCVVQAQRQPCNKLILIVGLTDS